MQLNLHAPDSSYFVRRVADATVTIVDRELSSSFLVSPDALVEDWPVTDVLAMQPSDADAILALAPEVVLLGAGARLRFPPAAVRAAFLTRGIGVEVMDNAAAGRTFNVLAQEGRRVVAAFILPG